jgi:hypothetical protein
VIQSLAAAAKLVTMGTTDGQGHPHRPTRCARPGPSASLVVLGALWLVLWSASSAGAAAAPRLVAKPATGLHNGTVVQVTGARFKPHDHVFLVECLAVATGQGQCDISTATPATITAQGVLPRTRFKVLAGKIGSGSCGTTASNLKSCVINAGNANGGDTASAPIAFGAPKRAAKS